MASLPVNNNLNVLAAITNQTSGMPENPSGESGDSFGVVMSRVNAQTDNCQKMQTAKASTVAKNTVNTAAVKAGVAAGVTAAGAAASTQNASQNAQNAQKNAESGERTTDSDVKQTDTKSAANDSSDKKVSDDKLSNDKAEETVSDEQKEAVNEAGEKLVKEVAEEMEITPEEVEEAMAVLGLSALQLLEPDNMKQLLLTLSGNEDHLSILTDGELYGHLQTLLNEVSLTLEDLQTELGLSEEELNALIADMAVVEADTEAAAEVIPEAIPAQDDLAAQDVEAEGVNPEAVKDYAVTVHKDGETVKVKVTVDNASGDKSMKEEVTAKVKPQVETEAKSDSKDSSTQDKGEGSTANSFMVQTNAEQPLVNEIVQEQPFMERYVDTQDIMNQIGEYIKLNLKADVQELELQLHPASLGNVNIQITAKDGMITAQFTTQNEAVKAAIESQLVQLRTQFDEQGLKVDAVEVAVADYRFNQSFSSNGENAGEGAEGKKRQRKINLNELNMEELPEDMGDSERITAQMMAQNGNTVDYTA